MLFLELNNARTKVEQRRRTADVHIFRQRKPAPSAKSSLITDVSAGGAGIILYVITVKGNAVMVSVLENIILDGKKSWGSTEKVLKKS